MIVASKTHMGYVRRANEDSLLVQPRLYAIADGMGGHRGGQEASQGAVNVMREALKGRTPNAHDMEWAIQAANRRVYQRACHDTQLEGMGTTLTALWEGEQAVYIGHVGDSRAYLYREGKLKQITQDHSMVAQMISDGLLTPEKARTHPYRNVITRAVGTAPGVEVDVIEVTRHRQDRWLLCSDGLHSMMEPEEIERYLSAVWLEDAAQALLEKALENGGRDNISLILLDEEVAP